MSNTNAIGEMLRLDPLHEAEKLTGKSYKDDEATSMLGMLMHMDHTKEKERALKDQDDTTFSNKLDNYVRIIEDEGFELVLTTPFVDSDGVEENMFTYWNPEGVLLRFDTYGATKVNGGKFYYNWRPYQCANLRGVTSSGGYREYEGEMIWSGDHDCREAFRHKMRQLRSNGKFTPKWVSSPFVWMLHYMDTKQDDYDHKAITEERIALLPEHVRDAITVVE